MSICRRLEEDEDEEEDPDAKRGITYQVQSYNHSHTEILVFTVRCSEPDKLLLLINRTPSDQVIMDIYWQLNGSSQGLCGHIGKIYDWKVLVFMLDEPELIILCTVTLSKQG